MHTTLPVPHRERCYLGMQPGPASIMDGAIPGPVAQTQKNAVPVTRAGGKAYGVDTYKRPVGNDLP